MKNRKEIIERIEYYLKKQNMSRYKLAKKSGIPESTIGNMFFRGTAPDIISIQKIVYNGFGITMAEFFEETEETD